MKFLSKNCVTAAIIKTKYNLVGENFVSCGECNYFEKRLEKRLKEKNISVIITSQLDIDYFCLNKVNNVFHRYSFHFSYIIRWYFRLYRNNDKYKRI
jgi:hypothetical protein